MKIGHFPDFLPDETVFSVAGRYLDRMQFRSHIIVSQHFFGRRTKGGVTDLPSSLEHLVQALPPHHIYTADTIIDQHTLYPLYAPFLPSERALTLRQRMKTDGTAVHWIAGIVTSKVSRSQWLRYCPACIDYDRVTYGECYWHRIHQVPGVLVCPIHEVMLEDSPINLLFGSDITKFCSAERSVGKLPQRIVPEHLRALLVQLARNAQWLLERPVSVEQGFIQQQYHGLLTGRGFATATGKVRYAKLREAVLDYYSAHLLEDLGCGIGSSKNNNWLKHWTTMQHPLHHLLFIQFLCETSQEFFTKPQDLSTPFGNGPWPCLNPLCSHYKERVIMSYAAKQGDLNRPIATFSCLCGFTYSRTGPDTDDDGMFRVGRVAQFGNIWDQHLTAYWLDQNVSTLQVARLMHTKVETIRRQAARLGLPFAPDIPRRGNRPKIYQDVIKEQRDVYRALWEEALKAYQNAGIRKVVKTVPKAYIWLYRHDRDWLKEHWPAASLFSKSERLVLSKTQLIHNSYSKVDAGLAKVVRETAEEICAKSDFPVQVTRQLLIVQIGEPTLLKRSSVAFDSLPLTSHALSEAIETSTAFIWRKLRWSVQSYLAEQARPSYRAFLSRARIGYNTATRPIIKQLIQIAYQSLRAGTPLSNQIPDIGVKVEKRTESRDEDTEAMTPGSLAVTCIDKQLMLPHMVTGQMPHRVYDLVPILLLTVAAVVNGAQTRNAIASWGFQNEELLRWFGLPEGHFPSDTALRKMYAKLNKDTFESVLGIWLHETFPQVQSKTNEMTIHSRGIYVPGVWLLRPYQHIASEVVARLR